MKFADVLKIMIIVILVLTLAISISFLKSDGDKCVKNPFVFGAKAMKNINDAPLYCSCYHVMDERNELTFSSEDDYIEYTIGEAPEELVLE